MILVHLIQHKPDFWSKALGCMHEINSYFVTRPANHSFHPVWEHFTAGNKLLSCSPVLLKHSMKGKEFNSSSGMLVTIFPQLIQKGFHLSVQFVIPFFCIIFSLEIVSFSLEIHVFSFFFFSLLFLDYNINSQSLLFRKWVDLANSQCL